MASYSAVIDLRVNGLQDLKAVEDRVKAIQNIQKQLKPVPGLFDKRTTAAIKTAKEELSKYVIQAGKGDTSTAKFSSTMAGLTAQMRAFNTVAANSTTESEEFTQALNASERASIKLKKAELERLNVLNKFYTPKTVGGSVNVKEILDLGKTIPKSVSGLEFYQRELQETLRIVDIGSKDFRDLSLAIADVNEQLSRVGNVGGIQGPKIAKGGFPSSPLGGRSGGRGGRSRTQDVLTGFGFPLLFGGGPAQALAGGIGGAFGGLGGSIIASAVVSQFEGLAVSVAKTGQALTSTGNALDFVREKSLFSSQKTEELSYKLEELGDVEGLAELLTKELADKIGNDGVKALKDLGTESNETTRLWNELTLQLQVLIAGPLTDFLKIVNSALRGITLRSRFEALRQDLKGNEEFQAEVSRREGLRGRGARRGSLTSQDYRELLKQFGSVRPSTVTIPVTPADRRTLTAKGTDKAAKEEQRLQERIARLKIETAEIKKQTEYKVKITQAEIAQDRQLAIRLRGEQAIDKILSETRKNLVKVTDSRERQAILQKQIALVDAASKNTAGELARFEAERTRNFENTVRNLEYAYQIETATTFEQQKQLQIQQELANLAASGQFTPEQLASIQALKERANIGQVQSYVNELTRQLNDTEGVIISLSQTIESSLSGAMSSALTDVVNGTKTVELVFAELFGNIGQAFLDMATQMIAKALMLKALGILLPGGGSFTFSGGSADAGLSAANLIGGSGFKFPRFANGGTPPVGKASIVGERGPELFVPRSSGTIVPNDKMMGDSSNVVVNVDASGTKVQGDNNQASQLGKVIGAAVQAELIKQKRPGGLLAGT